MPGFLGGSSGGSSGTGGEISFPKEFIDPVTKLRISQPENLIDTDFEYGLQPTKWETVELINNTPSFFSKSGDTTIPNIVSITTNAGTREITVVCGLEHGVSVGIPIQVTGTKSVTADGSYIINSIPNTTTFTYLCKANQPTTASIEDLYSSIITGEFFQGSQLRVADASGIVTNNAEGTSTLTVTTESAHGFKTNTPFYFLNLNSTISKDFQASNTAAKSFDSTNSAVAQTFDGSNTLSSINIDWSNSATVGGVVSTISAVSTVNNTITVVHSTENFANQPLGTPLYYAVTGGSGYFATNPRGVIFLKSITNLGVSTSTFQVSATPDGTLIPITAALSGTFQLANQARTFAGNNRNPLTEIALNVVKESEVVFDGGNQGFAGTQTNGLCTVEGYSGTILVSVTAGAGLDYYTGAMVRYTTTGTAATGLVNNATYFINSFTASAIPNLFNITIRALPGIAPDLAPTGGSGTQTFQKIGVSTDKDVVHIKNANFVEKDMIEYVFPENGRFTAATGEETKIYYFVERAYDSHNYLLSQSVFSPISATGGTTSEITFRETTYRVHTFTNTGTTNFVVANAGSIPTVEYLIVAGGGGGGSDMGGGGGAGGFLTGTTTVTAQTYPIVVGLGGQSSGAAYAQPANNGQDGGNSSALGLTAIGGGGGGGGHRQDNMVNTPGRLGGSGGGAAGRLSNPGAGTSGQGFGGTFTGTEWNAGSGGGAGGAAGPAGTDALMAGPGRASSITGTTIWYAGGGGRGGYTFESGNGGVGGGGGGAGGASGLGRGVGGVLGLNLGGDGVPGFVGTSIIGGSGGANTGGGAGGHSHQGTSNVPRGGSGIVVIRYPITALPDFTAAVATGGSTSTIVSSGITYRIHAFTNIGTTNFVVTTPGNWNDFEYLIVGGGGGGGGWGGGGGAGGVRTGRVRLAAGTTYPVVVGNGGVRGTSAYSAGANGGLSSAFGITSSGGGGGGWYSGNNGLAGASGGGGGLAEGGGTGGAGGAATPVTNPIQGNPGGRAGNNPTGNWQTNRAGGGGGAGEKGYDGDGNGLNAGRGGRGLDFSFLFGTSFGQSGWFGGGGGGHNAMTGNNNTGGQGGGGRGGMHAGGNGNAAASGLPNTGGGGGGAWGGNAQEAIGDGGSGIVLVRYPIAIA
jgi:hypothetical protein